MNLNSDILQQLFEKYPFKQYDLNRLVCGSKYCAIKLENDNIGVCSTLGVTVDTNERILEQPDFTRIDHRILANAWINACANYSLPANGEGDIFDAVDFSVYKRIVMVGYFGSLSAKFQSKGIDVTIFDLDPIDKPVAPMETQKFHLSMAETVILSATSISNLTFNDLMANTSGKADVYILGPSTPLDALLLSLPRVKALFGARFNHNDKVALEIIREGGGTKRFLPFIKKVYFYRE